MPNTVTADFSAIVKYTKRLEKQDATAFRKRIRKVVTKVGEDVLKDIKASSSWSTGKHGNPKKYPHTSIGKATRLKTSFAARSAGVKVATNAKMAPHARPLEGRGGRSVNRHPVFGRSTIGPLREGQTRRQGWTYVNQPTKPFFFDNASKGAKDLPVKLQVQLAEIAKELGY